MTTRRLKSITPLQAGKVMAALHGAMSLIFVPFLIGFAMLASFLPKTADAPPSAVMIGIAIGLAIVMPLFYAATGFVTGLIGAVVYNLIAGWVGGLEVEVE
jgi:hypothetical protein